MLLRAQAVQGINDLEVTGGIGKSYFARVIGRGIRLELIKTRSERGNGK